MGAYLLTDLLTENKETIKNKTKVVSTQPKKKRMSIGVAHTHQCTNGNF